MSSKDFIEFHVKRYRSLLDVKLNMSNSEPIVICGENNIGKTNFLRALNVYFEHFSDEALYSAERDIPHHIYHGTRGGGANTELVGTFLVDSKKKVLSVNFDSRGWPSYKLDRAQIDVVQAQNFLADFKFLFVESTNIDLPKLISLVLEKDGLLPLDNKRKRQAEPLEKLKEFITLSQTAISDIEKDINNYFAKLTDFDGVLKNKKVQIKFAEFEKLRDVVKNMTSITLRDGNNHGIASKGSGAQRAVFLSLLQFIAANSKKKVIWGIDEPEAFLQPRLQKKVFSVLTEMVKDRSQKIILTTHSQHFVNLKNLTHSHVFVGKISERKYLRKPDEIYYEVDTTVLHSSSDFEKASNIKQQLGIHSNDGWEVMPFNIVVEGEEDKKYLEAMFVECDYAVPNIVWAGGASKIGGYLQYYNSFAKDLAFKPKFRCVFDNDEEGRQQAGKVKKYQNIDAEVISLPRHDGAVPEKLKGADWEIEDFLPPKAVFSALNHILKKDGYKALTKAQMSSRGQPAHLNKNILKYLDECITHNNADKPSFKVDDDGRKLQLCQQICSSIMNGRASFGLSSIQKSFLKRLVE